MKHNAAYLEKRIKVAIATLEGLLAPAQVRGRGSVLNDLCKRVEMPAEIDGFPRGGDGQHTSGGSVSDPTQSAAMARMHTACTNCRGGSITLEGGRVVRCRACGGSGKIDADPVTDAVDEIARRLSYVFTATRNIERRRNMIDRAAKPRGRVSTLQGSCEACNTVVTGVGEDRLRSGFDNKCYVSWTSYKLKHESSDPGGQYRAFIAWRKQSLDSRASKEMGEIDRLQNAGNLPKPRSA